LHARGEKFTTGGEGLLACCNRNCNLVIRRTNQMKARGSNRKCRKAGETSRNLTT